MLDEFKEEQIVNKVGGRFKLSSLIQKRLVALTAAPARWSNCRPRIKWKSSSPKSCRTRSTSTRRATWPSRRTRAPTSARWATRARRSTICEPFTTSSHGGPGPLLRPFAWGTGHWSLPLYLRRFAFGFLGAS